MRPSKTSRIAACYIAATLGLAGPAIGQTIYGMDPSALQLAPGQDCSALASQLSDQQSGGQWLIGDGLDLYPASPSNRPITTLDGMFEPVSCYSRVESGAISRAFVASDDLSYCGWIETDALQDPHIIGDAPNLRGGPRPACETPRAMLLQGYCDEVEAFYSDAISDCTGTLPQGLRAKGVLLGSTTDQLTENYPFMTAPIGGTERSSRLFFSVLEIHEVARGPGDSVMALVGDGEGEMFGWIDSRAIQLWPTRLGLFYDRDGTGRMFQSEGSMLRNARSRGTPAPDIAPGLSTNELADYVHGDLPLLSYPIVSTADPELDPTLPPGTPPFHKVIFLGQTGDGSASQLMSEAELAREIEDIQRINVSLVIDTTESMQPYLPAVREGISDFIRGYRAQKIDPANRLPDMRIGVVGYADFADGAATGIYDAVVSQQLMQPTRVEPGLDPESALDGISAHQGLSDTAGGSGPCGPYSEAALEAVSQVALDFGKNPIWFENGPRIILHMADHGSRKTADLDAIERALDDAKIYYVPIAVTTDDRGDDRRRCARENFESQAQRLFTSSVDDGDVATAIPRINFDQPTQTADMVRSSLDIAMNEVIQAAGAIREGVLGEELSSAARQRQDASRAQDMAASRIRIDERILEDRGLDPDRIEVIVQASTGYAPAWFWDNNRQVSVPWTYTVSLERSQADELTQKFGAMCDIVGRPEQGRQFRELILDLAESFSGDSIQTDAEVQEVLSDLSDIPGASRSLLAQPPQVLLQRADSTDAAVIEGLRRDVCWVSYHLNNMQSESYARPDQVAWTGSEYALRAGEQISRRNYVYRPVVGAEAVYLPSFFFVLPEFIEEEQAEPACQFFSC